MGGATFGLIVGLIWAFAVGFNWHIVFHCVAVGAFFGAALERLGVADKRAKK